MSMRGVRGAITVSHDSEIEVLNATRELLIAILNENSSLEAEDIASVLFTVTEDIDSAFPAKAAREMGWISVPLMCVREIPVPGSLPLCIRVLIHWNTELSQDAINHVYLKAAKSLRLDLEHTKDDQN